MKKIIIKKGPKGGPLLWYRILGRARHEEGRSEKSLAPRTFLFAKDYRTMTSGWQKGAPYLQATRPVSYRRSWFFIKPAIFREKKVRAGATVYNDSVPMNDYH